jgi:hypothetical protein
MCNRYSHSRSIQSKRCTRHTADRNSLPESDSGPSALRHHQGWRGERTMPAREDFLVSYSKDPNIDILISLPSSTRGDMPACRRIFQTASHIVLPIQAGNTCDPLSQGDMLSKVQTHSNKKGDCWQNLKRKKGGSKAAQRSGKRILLYGFTIGIPNIYEETLQCAWKVSLLLEIQVPPRGY